MEIISVRSFFISCALSNCLYPSIWLSYKSPVYIHIFLGKQVCWFLVRTQLYCKSLPTSARDTGSTVIQRGTLLKPCGDCSLSLICLWVLATSSFLHNIIFKHLMVLSMKVLFFFSRKCKHYFTSALPKQERLSCSFWVITLSSLEW